MIKDRLFVDVFSCLQASIRLRRSATYHAIQSYIPSALIVVISSVSFWLGKKDGKIFLRLE
jgi:hypothetical protein